METRQQREQPRTSDALKRTLDSRWFRVPLIVAAAFVVGTLFAVWFQDRWLSFCEQFKDPGDLPCQPIGEMRMVAYVTIGLGVLTMIFGPMINTLYRLARYGQPWETTRHETAVSNIPIVAGLFYLALGTALFFA
jgi:hypothetical protein